MLEKVLDGLKGVGKLIGWSMWILIAVPWFISQWLLELEMSADIKAKKKLIEENIPKTIKKRAPRKKKVVENVALTA